MIIIFSNTFLLKLLIISLNWTIIIGIHFLNLLLLKFRLINFVLLLLMTLNIVYWKHVILIHACNRRIQLLILLSNNLTIIYLLFLFSNTTTSSHLSRHIIIAVTILIVYLSMHKRKALRFISLCNIFINQFLWVIKKRILKWFCSISSTVASIRLTHIVYIFFFIITFN